MTDTQVSDLAKTIKSILRTDRDFVLALSGGTGEGKSTLSLILAMLVNPSFSIKDQVTFSRKDTIDRITTLNKYSCVVVDEAINILFRRDFMKYQQKQLLKLLDMCRDRNLCLIFNIPVFWSLDTHVQARIRAWIHIVKRGKGALFRPSNNPFSKDVWNRKYNEGVVSKGKLFRSKNFINFLDFDKLPQDIFLEYLKVKNQKKKQLELEEKKEIYFKSDIKMAVDHTLIAYTYWLRREKFLKTTLKNLAEHQGYDSDLFRKKFTRIIESDSTIDSLIKDKIYSFNIENKSERQEKDGQD